MASSQAMCGDTAWRAERCDGRGNWGQLDCWLLCEVAGFRLKVRQRSTAPQVDYSGFSTINTQRFGQKFVGKVANPHDMVLWQKAPQRRAKARMGGRRPG